MTTQHIRVPMLTPVLVTLTTTVLFAAACDVEDEGAAQDTEAEALHADEDDVVDLDIDGVAVPERDPEDRPDVEAPTDELTLEVDPQAYVADVGPFSEEQWAGLCGPGQAVQSIRCTGSYCDNLSLDCEPHGGIVYGDGFLNYDISEEFPDNFALCPLGGMVDGIHCSGSYCDNLMVHCEYTNLVRSNVCAWSGWFSEEQGWANVPPGTAVAGIWCSGRYCDSKNLYWCLMTD